MRVPPQRTFSQPPSPLPSPLRTPGLVAEMAVDSKFDKYSTIVSNYKLVVYCSASRRNLGVFSSSHWTFWSSWIVYCVVSADVRQQSLLFQQLLSAFEPVSLWLLTQQINNANALTIKWANTALLKFSCVNENRLAGITSLSPVWVFFQQIFLVPWNVRPLQKCVLLKTNPRVAGVFHRRSFAMR